MISRCLLIHLLFCCAATYAENRTDVYGDPLPENALVRMGTVRYRHPGWYKRIDFLSDNRTIVIGTQDNTIRFWDARSGKQVREVDVAPMRVQAFSVTPDGSAVAIVKGFYLELSREYNIELLIEDAKSGETLNRIRWIEGLQDGTCAVDVSPRGDVVAVGSRSGKVKILNRETGMELKSVEIVRGEIDGMSFSPSGHQIMVAGRREVKQWNWQTDDEPIALSDLPRGGQFVAYLNDGNEVLVGSSDRNAATIHGTDSGKIIRTLQGENSRYYREGLGISADGKTAAIPGNKAIEIFDLSTGKLLRTFDCGSVDPRGAAYSRDGKLLTAIGSESIIYVWDLATGENLTEEFVGHVESAYELLFTPHGKQVVSGSLDGLIQVWEAATGRHLRTLKHDSGKWVSALDISSDGKQLLSCSLDDSVRLWDFESGTEVFKLFGHGTSGGNQMTLARFVGENRICTFGMDLWLRFYDRTTGKLLVEHPIRPKSLNVKDFDDGEPKLDRDDGFGRGMQLGRAAIVPDGSRLLVSDSDQILIFDTETGKELRAINFGAARDFAISADGKRIASAIMVRADNGRRVAPKDQRSILQIHDFESGKVLLEQEIRGSAGQVEFSPDGRLIVAQLYGESPSGATQWSAIFDASSGEQTAIIDSIDQRSSKFVFSPDLRHLVGSYEDTSILVWDVDKLPISDQPALK